MAKVSLRIYNREIENLIDQGNINEAIAHCHHILKTFPKHLSTYRLLGKSYLELKRHAEAVDIFSRVLMAVPDDYVSHVGMSIIYDEQRKMDEAIWHMERAFETQSSNAAIQGELQRLYGRRDGMEPPRIRMTRGALAHLYVQGELYPQAIAEIRAVLAEEPDRPDMQVLLARAYFRGGQKADASDMCAQLLKRYQYCFDANRIMVDLLPATAGAAESTQVYRMRVGEMDPYATFAKDSVFLSHEVPDASISVERLEYKGEEPPAGQAWTSSLGLGAGIAAAPAIAATASTSESDWPKVSSMPETTPAAPEEIPDFLRQAGWGASTTPEQPTSIFDEEPASGSLAPAELPDWLKGQEPVNTAPTPPSQPESTPAIEVPDWLLDNSQTSEAGTGEVPDWLKEASQAPAEPAKMDETSAWLNQLDGKQPPSEPLQKDAVTDWLGELDEKQAPAAEAANVPDWLSGLDGEQASAAEAADVPDWLRGLDTPQETATEPEKVENVPDWLSGLDTQDQKTSQPAPSVEGLGSTAQEQDDAVAWLESLAAKHGAKPEELVTDPSKRSEKPPEWVAQAQNIGQETPTVSVESLGASAQEQDDAVAWLESLAAKHGAKPEELVTDPSKRSEKPPEWVAQAQSANQETPAPQTPAASVESLGATSSEQDDAVAWLESLAAKHGAKPEELVTDPSKRSEKPPEWVAQAQSIGESQPTQPEQKPEIVENALNIGEQFFAEFESASGATPVKDETSTWLEDLAKEEEQTEKSESFGISNEIPDWLSDAKAETRQLDSSEIPEWLNDAQTPQDTGGQFEFKQEELPAEKSELPNWLSDVDSETPSLAATSENMTEGDLANWLNTLDDEPGLPFESMPTPDSILFDSQARPPVKPKGSGPAEEKSELPDWLSEVDVQGSKMDDEWKESTTGQAESLPSWFEETSEEAGSSYQEDDTSPWHHRERWEAEEPQYPTPTSPSDWHPLEPQQVETKPAPKQEIPVETHKAFVPPPPQPDTQPVLAPIPQSEAPAKKKSGLPARKRLPESANAIVALNQAKSELDRGDIPAALAHYGKLIKKGKHIEETIRDLTESIYRYPVEVGIWQTLGDAYMRANRLKEALEAYNKAEELIR